MGEKMGEKISIIIPVIRPEKAKRCIASIYKNGGLPDSQFEIVTEEDHDRIGAPKMIKKLVAKAKHDIVCFLGDDTTVEEDCLKNALDTMQTFPDGWGMVGLNDQHHDGSDVATHWMAHKRLLPFLDGEFFHTGYKHTRCDVELTERCIELGRYIHCLIATITHHHPHTDKALMDEDYMRVYDRDMVVPDQRLYRQRKLDRVGPTLAIAFPLIDDDVSVQFMVSFLAMEKPDFTLLMPRFKVGRMATNIAGIRNDLISQAMGMYGSYSHVIMLDTDQLYPLDTITKMLQHAVDGYKMVGTPVHRSWPPFDPILYRGKLGKYKHVPDEECYSGDMVEVDATGCGAVMYSTDIFLDIPMPWYEIRRGLDGKTVGEDVGVCWKIRNAGHKIFVDTSIEIGHLVKYEVKRETYELYKRLNHMGYREATECYTDYNEQYQDSLFLPGGEH
jgi:hypothetical protein